MPDQNVSVTLAIPWVVGPGAPSDVHLFDPLKLIGFAVPVGEVAAVEASGDGVNWVEIARFIGGATYRSPLFSVIVPCVSMRVRRLRLGIGPISISVSGVQRAGTVFGVESLALAIPPGVGTGASLDCTDRDPSRVALVQLAAGEVVGIDASPDGVTWDRWLDFSGRVGASLWNLSLSPARFHRLVRVKAAWPPPTAQIVAGKFDVGGGGPPGPPGPAGPAGPPGPLLDPLPVNEVVGSAATGLLLDVYPAAAGAMGAPLNAIAGRGGDGPGGWVIAGVGATGNFVGGRGGDSVAGGNAGAGGAARVQGGAGGDGDAGGGIAGAGAPTWIRGGTGGAGTAAAPAGAGANVNVWAGFPGPDLGGGGNDGGGIDVRAADATGTGDAGSVWIAGGRGGSGGGASGNVTVTGGDSAVGGQPGGRVAIKGGLDAGGGGGPGSVEIGVSDTVEIRIGAPIRGLASSGLRLEMLPAGPWQIGGEIRARAGDGCPGVDPGQPPTEGGPAEFQGGRGGDGTLTQPAAKGGVTRIHGSNPGDDLGGGGAAGGNTIVTAAGGSGGADAGSVYIGNYSVESGGETKDVVLGQAGGVTSIVYDGDGKTFDGVPWILRTGLGGAWSVELGAGGSPGAAGGSGALVCGTGGAGDGANMGGQGGGLQLYAGQGGADGGLGAGPGGGVVISTGNDGNGDPSSTLQLTGATIDLSSGWPDDRGALAIHSRQRWALVPIAAGDVVLTGWGVGASVSAIAGNSSLFLIQVTAGAGPAANPTIRLTFPTAPWAGSPLALVKVDNTNDPAAYGYPTSTTESAADLLIVMRGLPVAGRLYDFKGICVAY